MARPRFTMEKRHPYQPRARETGEASDEAVEASAAAALTSAGDAGDRAAGFPPAPSTAPPAEGPAAGLALDPAAATAHVSPIVKLRDHAYALMRSPRRRAAAVAALVVVLALDAYLLHARSDRTGPSASAPGAAVTAGGNAAEGRHGGQSTLRDLAAARDRSQTAASSPDEPSSPEYAWPIPARPVTRDPDEAPEPPPSSRATAEPMTPLGPTSPPSPISRLPRVFPPPPAPLPAPPLPPSGSAGRSGEDEAETAAASAGAATTLPEAQGDTGLPPARPAARPPAPAEPDDDTAPPPPPPKPSFAFAPNTHSAIPGSMRPRRAGDLNGSWEIHDVVDATSEPAYRALRLTYRIILHQDGERVSGDGEKWAENGRRIPAAQRTPIHLSGEIEGREVRVRFTENGSRRDSAGSFRWRLSADGTSCAGTFASNAAGSRGVSAAVRLP
jgi:hypothetical protein